MESNLTKPRPSLWRTVVIGRQPKFTLVRILVLIGMIILTRQFFLVPIQVIGPSMLPTYQDHGVNFVNRRAYDSRDPQRGDVIAIRYSGPSMMLMKRIIGLPGETVAFHEGRAVINGRMLDEPYVQYKSDWDTDDPRYWNELQPVTLRPDQYFVVGDNRSMTPNLHTFGGAERQRIIGKILLCKNLFASPLP